MRIKNYSLFIAFFLLAAVCYSQSRKVIGLPDIPGYQTLKCDFHMHTVFSDGTVWPTVRVEEAWREGLDAIAISDHIEYRPHSKDVVADHNRSYEIARPMAEVLDIVLVHAAEITRSMPPGHLNALFIENANLLEREDVFDAVQEARDQGAFLLWNHPGWKVQQPDSTLWWEEHTRLLENDMLHGIEVFNNAEYYPEALDWAMEKNLSVICNSDMHGPMNMAYNLVDGHRPVTLVFAEERTTEGIKEAMFNRRTVAYFKNTLMGEAQYLEPLFFQSLEMDDEPVKLKNEENHVVEILNKSDMDYELELVQPGLGFEAPETLILKAHHVTPVELRGNSEEVENMNELAVYYQVKNMYVEAEKNLVVTISFQNK